MNKGSVDSFMFLTFLSRNGEMSLTSVPARFGKKIHIYNWILTDIPTVSVAESAGT